MQANIEFSHSCKATNSHFFTSMFMMFMFNPKTQIHRIKSNKSRPVRPSCTTNHASHWDPPTPALQAVLPSHKSSQQIWRVKSVTNGETRINQIFWIWKNMCIFVFCTCKLKRFETTPGNTIWNTIIFIELVATHSNTNQFLSQVLAPYPVNGLHVHLETRTMSSL